MRPSIGRIVHYKNAVTGDVDAAIITRVHDVDFDERVSHTVSLHVFSEDHSYPVKRTKRSEKYPPADREWYWPPREAEGPSDSGMTRTPSRPPTPAE